ncbi:ADAMTS-like protein 5 isoform X2 [Lingula anatina]|nr:ADAMTS-like protein 5 isoform X2 [Lingula anatina]|eukprot:XP_013391286.1 ADAMTS-like protein 5 isoform X2 [Lingula anatina]
MECTVNYLIRGSLLFGAVLLSLIQINCGQYSARSGDIYQGPFFPIHPGPWSDWSGWSKCSRTCGAGIKTRSRQCRGYDSAACSGDREEYATCNTKPCPEGSLSFRDYQCSRHNGKKVLGRKVAAWEAYLSNLTPCDLRCKAKDVTFYYGFGTVLDGTKCNDETHDVCIKGKCQKVGCDGRIGSDLKEDMCMVCGGRNDTCYHFQSAFYTDDTETVSGRRYGYEEIATVPIGATHITVKDSSDNYLAVTDSKKKYIINGGWSITWPGKYNVAGTVVQYERDWENKETISIAGPTTEVIYLMVLLRSSNPGITYGYWLPKKSLPPDGNRDKYNNKNQKDKTRHNTYNDNGHPSTYPLRRIPGYPSQRAALQSTSSDRGKQPEEQKRQKNVQKPNTRDDDRSYNQRMNEYARNYRKRYHRTTRSIATTPATTTTSRRPYQSQYNPYGNYYNTRNNNNINQGTSTKDRLYVYRGYNNFRPGKYIYQRNYEWTTAAPTKSFTTSTTRAAATSAISTVATTSVGPMSTTTSSSSTTTAVPNNQDIFGFTLDDADEDLIVDPVTGKCFECPYVRDWQAEYCDSDFVIRAKVNGGIKSRGAMRYDISVIQTYKTTVPMLPREYVWVPNLCGCPDLRTNEQYIMMGKNAIHGREVRLELDHRSLVRKFGRRYAIYMRNVKSKTDCKTYKRRPYY